MAVFMILVVIGGFAVCAKGLQGGVGKDHQGDDSDRLLVLMVILAVHSVMMDNSGPGLEFYLKPDFRKIQEAWDWGEVSSQPWTGVLYAEVWESAPWRFSEAISAGAQPHGRGDFRYDSRYLRSLYGRTDHFPACFAFSIEPGQGPKLIL